MLCPARQRLTAQEVLDHEWFKKMINKPSEVEFPPIITRQLKTFRNAQKIMKVVLTYLATQLSEREIEPLKKLFMSLDKNGDGILSLEEITEGLKGRPDERELYDVITSMDTDGSGFVDYNGKRVRDRVS